MGKRIRIISVLSLAILLLAGCGNKNTENQGTPAPTNPPTEEELMIARMKELTAMDVVSQMKIGWNLGNTMDSTNSTALKASKPSTWETAWGNPVTSEALIDTIIAQGFNVIRIPVSWVDHIMPGGEYKIEEKYTYRNRINKTLQRLKSSSRRNSQ